MQRCMTDKTLGIKQICYSFNFFVDLFISSFMQRREYSDNQFRLMSLYGGGIRNIKLIRGIHRSTIHRYNSISFEKQIQDDLDKALTKISTIPPYQVPLHAHHTITPLVGHIVRLGRNHRSLLMCQYLFGL